MAKQLPLLPAYARMETGVRVRSDGGGDGWANAHRTALGNRFYLQDVDAVAGIEWFATNTAERVFAEYEPDSWENRLEVIRRFALVAMFDRKSTIDAAFSPQNRISSAFYLHLCRTHVDRQPRPPRFFFLVGGQKPPWEMVELDIDAGDEIGNRVEINGQNMRGVWDAIGLTELRKFLRRWLLQEGAA